MPSPTRAVLRAELKLFSREPGSLFWIMAFPPGLVGVLGLVPAFREPNDDLDGGTVIGLYVPVAIQVAILFAAVSAMPVVLATYREQRILRRIATTPAKPRALLIAQYVIYGGAGIVGGALAVLVGRLAYDVGLPGNLVAYLFVLALVLGACLGIGGIVTAASPTGKIATAVGTVLIFPMMFTAGVWLPVQGMPSPLQDIVALTPLGAGALALEQAASGAWPDGVHLLVLAAWIAVLGAGATRFFRWE